MVSAFGCGVFYCVLGMCVRNVCVYGRPFLSACGFVRVICV